MKRVFVITAAILALQYESRTQTNDFYDDAPLNDLKMNEILISGEVANPGKINLSLLPVRDVIVKETGYNGERGSFTGAYLYEGYSLYDILNSFVIKKNNEAEFPPIIDLFVEIENKAGEKVVLSWGEIYYPIHRHEILIAAKVRRIVPSKTKELWPLSEESKLIVATDLYTERNISNPVKITVRSSTLKFKIDRNIPDMYAGELKLMRGTINEKSIAEGTIVGKMVSYGSVFYGRGTGIHGTTPFSGAMLKDIAAEYFVMNRENLMTGLFITSAPDGYRAVFTYSEIFNRNDQAEVLIVPMHGVKSQGAFLLYPAADFFSDRSVRCCEKIIFIQSSDM